MEIAGLALTVVGAGFNLTGACWLLWGFNENNPRYVDDGPLVPGRQKSQVVPNLLRDQRKVTALSVVGSSLLLLGAVLVVIAAVRAW